MTVATQSREQKKVIVDALEKTGCGTDFLDVQFALNDFGCRGVSSMETAAIGGAGRLLQPQPLPLPLPLALALAPTRTLALAPTRTLALAPTLALTLAPALALAP